METVAAASYAGTAAGATRSPACCAAMSFSQSYKPKASRPPTAFYGESVRVSTARPLAARQTKAASRAALGARCEIGDSLEEFLTKATPDKNLIRLLTCMGEAMRTIAFKVRTASCGGTACVNSFGDEQLAVDMLANKLLFDALEYSHVCKYACSEEVPELQDMGGPVDGGFSVAFDPLDGSSIVDTNFTVGTIFGVWPGDKLTGVTGGDQVAAAMGIYGPRTTYVIALKDCPGTHEFLLLDEGKWQHVKDTTSIGEGKMFSPGNLRATFDNPEYDKLINYYVKEKYTLRYTGGMVPDVNQVVSELTHGTSQGEVSQAEFQEALSDILLGMAAVLKRDPIVILRMDGEDLRDFVASSRYEPSAAAIFSQVGSEGVPLRRCLSAALQQLAVDHGVPPASDAWVAENIVEPALRQLPADQLEQPASRDGFVERLRELLGAVAERLQEQAVIVAHTENTYDGSGVKRLLANKFELDKLLDSVWRGVPGEHKNKASKECLIAALDKMADAANLPHYGAVQQVDAVVNEAIKTANADGGKTVDEAEFKKLLTDTLGAVMRQLNSNPIFVSTNTVVHEPLSGSSGLFSPPPVSSSPK